MDDDAEPCAYCEATELVAWDEVHGWACHGCRQQRTYAMLDEKVTALPVRDETS